MQHRTGKTLQTRKGSEGTLIFPLSSEEPFRRYDGLEILLHEARNVDLSFLNSGSAPLLDSHDRWTGLEAQLGVIDRAWLENKRLYVEVRFSQRPRAQAVMQDIADGIIRNVSVGYDVLETARMSEDSYHVTKWMPKEASFVPIPADTTVGVGRSGQMEKPMPATELLPPVQPPVVDMTARAAEIADQMREIHALAATHNSTDVALTFIDAAMRKGEIPSLAAFRGVLRGKLPADKPLVNTNIGLTQKETRRFSIIRLARSMADNATEADIRASSFEREACEAAARVTEGETRGFRLPAELMNSWGDFEVDGQRSSQVRAPLSTGVNTQVQYTEHLGERFIDNLRNASSVMQAGATMLAGLEGNVDIPGGATNSVGAWLAAEDANAAETVPTFRKVSLAPKDVAGYTDLTRRMLQQSSIDVEAYARNQLLLGIGLAIDLAALSGSGASGVPLGVKGTAGIGSVAYAAVGASPTWAEIVAFETALANANALRGAPMWIMPPSMRGYLKTTEKAASTAQFIMDSNSGQVNGYGSIVSNQVLAADMYFGLWSDLLIGMWGSLDLDRDLSAKFLSGGVRLRGIQTVDSVVARVGSFVLGS